jgi:GNAT superfamily N-acetyltransferase
VPPRLPPDLSLRELKSSDASAIAELIGACDEASREWRPGWVPPTEAEERAKWQRRLAEPSWWARGAVDSDARLVGFVATREARDEGGSPIDVTGYVAAVFVLPSRWRRGIATALMELAEGAMLDRDWQSARLWVPELAPARRLYERLGWSPDGITERREGDEMPFLRYSKPLIAGGHVA